MPNARSGQALRSMLQLRVIPRLGDVGRRKLLKEHRSPAAALAAALMGRSTFDTDRIAHEARLALDTTEEIGASIVALGSSGYPRSLEQLNDPPTVLWLRGDASLLERPAVAIVGTRRNTDYGAEAAHSLAADLARAGVVVISGLAHGIDRFAHEGALDVGGATVAIVGTGIDITYPRRHKRLQERIAREGLLVSEFLPGEPAMRHHFPRRNRLIAALSSGVVVVEAPDKSGALNTVDHAMDLNREVFAVPGPIGRETSRGTNALIRDGAPLVMDAGDIMEALGMVPTSIRKDRRARVRSRHAVRADSENVRPMESGGRRADATNPGDYIASDPVLALLEGDPRHIDDIAAQANLPISAVMSRLLALEIEGRVRQAPGLRFGLAREAA